MTKEQRNEEMIKGQQMIIQSERGVNEKLKKTINELIKFNEDLLDDFKQAMEKQWKEREALGLSFDELLNKFRLLAEMKESITESFEKFEESAKKNKEAT